MGRTQQTPIFDPICDPWVLDWAECGILVDVWDGDCLGQSQPAPIPDPQLLAWADYGILVDVGTETALGYRSQHPLGAVQVLPPCGIFKFGPHLTHTENPRWANVGPMWVAFLLELCWEF